MPHHRLPGHDRHRRAVRTGCGWVSVPAMPVVGSHASHEQLAPSGLRFIETFAEHVFPEVSP